MKVPGPLIVALGIAANPLQPSLVSAAPPAAEAPPASLQLAPQIKGSRPRIQPQSEPAAATQLLPELRDLTAPPALGLPTKPDQVRLSELRPLTLVQAENLAEVNNPDLKAVASQVDQSQSNLRAQIALWYPTLNLQSRALPSYANSNSKNTYTTGTQYLSSDRWSFATTITAQWALINPQRVPAVAAARDQFERARYQYVVALRDLRLQVAQAYFDLQQADDGVRIGQQSVRASLVSLRDARARFQAGVATKLEVLEAETQLARDQQLLAEYLASQAIARRALAALLDLPQTVSPTSADPSRVIGIWPASLQESIVAAYGFREELDQALLDISIANSNANQALASRQPFLNLFTAFDVGAFQNVNPAQSSSFFSPALDRGYSYDTSAGMNFSWRLFDGGQARAQYREQKQRAQEGQFRFAQRRDQIRLQVEESFYELDKNNRNIITTSKEVISAREALRLARLRFQAGVTTQREVVDNQRDLTNAEVRYSNAITNYNKRLAELQRRTGLDQVTACTPPALPAVKPVDGSTVPVEPTPLLPACQAAARAAI